MSKFNKLNYFNFKREVLNLSPNSDLYIILGGRGNGKSYSIKNHAFTDAWKNRDINGHMVNILRRWDSDIKPSAIEGYFDDINVTSITNGTHNSIVIWRGYIYFTYTKDDKEDKDKRVKIGRITSLNQSERYKSNFDREAFGWIIYEEFITDDVYLPNEPVKLQEYLITVFGSSRSDGKCILIGNKISTVCPYYDYYCLHNVKKLTQGELICSKVDNLNLALYMTYDLNKRSKFMSGNHAVKANGDWDTRQYDLLSYADKCGMTLLSTVIYNFSFHYFKIDYYKDDNRIVTYIEPKTTPIKDKTRVVGDYVSGCVCTPDFTPLNDGERVLFDNMKNGYMYFASNLTGDEFRQVRQMHLQRYHFR